MFGLCDCNNFFVSCQRVFRPELNGKPVIVLSNNDGCVIARSNEAKKLNISMGMPMFQAKHIINRYGVEVFSSNYKLYGDMSSRVMSVLREAVPSIEVYSIDEAFLDFSGMDLDALESFGRALSLRVRKNTGIPVSIGIAPTKTLAKIASKLCKQYPKLKGCCFMYKAQDIEKVLRNFPIEDVWGIGRKHSKRLRAEGVISAYDFSCLSPEWVQKTMSITGLRTWRELKGESMIDFEHTVPDRQSITVSRSFAKELTSLEDLHTSITTFVALAAQKLRAQNSLTTQMQVFIYTNRHREDKAQTFDNAVVSFPSGCDSTLELASAAREALQMIFKPGYEYKKAGVIFAKLVSSSARQTSLFEDINNERHGKLMQVMDKINNTQGRSSLRLASEGRVGEFSSREKVSPEYTTQWKDILLVK